MKWLVVCRLRIFLLVGFVGLRVRKVCLIFLVRVGLRLLCMV